jgi:ketosteroid isomerase-like protein
MATITELIRQVFTAYQSKDRALVDALLSERLTFTSPYDDHIDKATYFARCWPNSDRIRVHHLERIFQQGDEAFVRYEAELVDGTRFRNVEYFRAEADQIVEIQVYFGQK